MTRLLLISLSLVYLLGSCIDDKYTPTSSPIDEMEDELIELVNDYRLTNGKLRLKYDNLAHSEAITYSNKISTGLLARLDDSQFDRSAKLLYEHRDADSVIILVAFNKQPIHVFNEWIADEDANAILLGRFTHTAVGITEEVAGLVYNYTQVFYHESTK